MNKLLGYLICVYVFVIIPSLAFGQSTAAREVMKRERNSDGKISTPGLEFADGTFLGTGNPTGVVTGVTGTAPIASSGGTTPVISLSDGGVANAKLGTMTTKTYKGRTAGTSGVPEDVAVATLKTDLVLVKGDVGLGNVDNTSDANKPVSTAAQTALDLKAPSDGATLTNVIISSPATLPAHLTLAGSGSTTIGVNETYTFTPQGTGKFVISGSGGGDVTGLEDGFAMGNASVYYSSLMASARQRPFAFIECYTNSSSSFDPLLGSVFSSGTIAGTAGVASHPGIVTLTSSTTTNSGAAIRGTVNGILLSGGEIIEVVFRLQATTSITRMGFFDTSTAAESLDAACITFNASAAITGNTLNNSSQSTTDVAYSVATNTWYRGVVAVNNAATRVDFTLYNMSGAVLWTDDLQSNIPTGRETGVGVISSDVGTTAIALVDIDYIAIGYLKGLTR